MTGKMCPCGEQWSNALEFQLAMTRKDDLRRQRRAIIRRKFQQLHLTIRKRGCVPSHWYFLEAMRRLERHGVFRRDVAYIRQLLTEYQDKIFAMECRHIEDWEQRDRTEDRLQYIAIAATLVLAQFDGIGDDGWPTRGMKQAIERLREAVK